MDPSSFTVCEFGQAHVGPLCHCADVAATTALAGNRRLTLLAAIVLVTIPLNVIYGGSHWPVLCAVMPMQIGVAITAVALAVQGKITVRRLRRHIAATRPFPVARVVKRLSARP